VRVRLHGGEFVSSRIKEVEPAATRESEDRPNDLTARSKY
jgi:hypothetical protein